MSDDHFNDSKYDVSNNTLNKAVSDKDHGEGRHPDAYGSFSTKSICKSASYKKASLQVGYQTLSFQR